MSAGHSDQQPLILPVHQRRREQKIGRRPVAGDWHVVHNRDPQQRFDVHVVRLRLERIPEKDHEIDATVDDGCADLLVAAERPAQEPSLNGIFESR
jgi:hypothetical protein